jgi:hypothetical protein
MVKSYMLKELCRPLHSKILNELRQLKPMDKQQLIYTVLSQVIYLDGQKQTECLNLLVDELPPVGMKFIPHIILQFSVKSNHLL